MRRLVWFVAVLALVVGAFALGRYSRSAREGDGAESIMARGGAMRGAVTGTSGKLDAQKTNGVAAPASATSAAAASALPDVSAVPTPSVPVSATARGPQPLTREDAAELAKAEKAWTADGGVSADSLALANGEPQDDGARRLEGLIAMAIQQLGGAYTTLRIAPPHCTQSVCIVRAAGPDATSQGSSNWQKLAYQIMSQPWARESFSDIRTIVTGDKGQTAYITLYIRK